MADNMAYELRRELIATSATAVMILRDDLVVVRRDTFNKVIGFLADLIPQPGDADEEAAGDRWVQADGGHNLSHEQYQRHSHPR